MYGMPGIHLGNSGTFPQTEICFSEPAGIALPAMLASRRETHDGRQLRTCNSGTWSSSEGRSRHGTSLSRMLHVRRPLCKARVQLDEGWSDPRVDEAAEHGGLCDPTALETRHSSANVSCPPPQAHASIVPRCARNVPPKSLGWAWDSCQPSTRRPRTRRLDAGAAHALVCPAPGLAPVLFRIGGSPNLIRAQANHVVEQHVLQAYCT